MYVFAMLKVQDWFMDKQKTQAAKAIADKKESDVPRPRQARKPKSKKKFSALMLSRKYNTCGYTRLPECAYDRPQKPRGYQFPLDLHMFDFCPHLVD